MSLFLVNSSLLFVDKHGPSYTISQLLNLRVEFCYRPPLFFWSSQGVRVSLLFRAERDVSKGRNGLSETHLIPVDAAPNL